jgi:hypothetical protein
VSRSAPSAIRAASGSPLPRRPDRSRNPGDPMMYNGINHLAFITRDMNATIRFYRDLLGFPLVSGVGNGAFKHYFFQVTPRDAIAFFS